MKFRFAVLALVFMSSLNASALPITKIYDLVIDSITATNGGTMPAAAIVNTTPLCEAGYNANSLQLLVSKLRAEGAALNFYRLSPADIGGPASCQLSVGQLAYDIQAALK